MERRGGLFWGCACGIEGTDWDGMGWREAVGHSMVWRRVCWWRRSAFPVSFPLPDMILHMRLIRPSIHRDPFQARYLLSLSNMLLQSYRKTPQTGPYMHAYPGIEQNQSNPPTPCS